MDPEQALRELADALRRIFPLLGEEARLQFVVNLVEEAGADKVTRSRQLMAVTDPEILPLFEDWLEELDEEVVAWIKKIFFTPAGGFSSATGAISCRVYLSAHQINQKREVRKYDCGLRTE